MARLIKIDQTQIDADLIRQAAEALKAGGLVIFPTDTVYGLGANALDEKAVRSVFQVKQRSFDNPLPVLIVDEKELERLAKEVPDEAKELASSFWPGGLTLVLKKSAKIPSIVTAGGDTVALRVPDHPVTLALLKETSVPLVGPSANISGEEAPADAAAINPLLTKQVDVIIDAGPAPVGIPSTIVDLTQGKARILREGAVTKKTLESVLK